MIQNTLLVFLQGLFVWINMLLLWVGFRSYGLIVFGILTTLVANFQVLKQSPIITGDAPLGTVVFCFSVIANQILAQMYSRQMALKSIYINLVTMLMFNINLWLSLLFLPTPEEGNLQVQQAMQTLFLPLVEVSAASLISYWIMQYVDLYIFLHLKYRLIINSVIAALISGLVDNFIFSFIAFYIFNNNLSFYNLITQYVLGTYYIRALFIIGSSLCINLSLKGYKKLVNIKVKFSI